MISSFESFYKKENVAKPTKTSRKHTQALNRNTIDRKGGLHFVPRSDNVKRSHPIIKKFEENKNLKFDPINIKIAEKLSKIFNRNISKENGDFTKSLGRTDLVLIRRGSKYWVVRKK